MTWHDVAQSVVPSGWRFLQGDSALGCELNQRYIDMAERRLVKRVGLFR